MKELEFALKTVKDAYEKCIQGRSFVIKTKININDMSDIVTDCDQDTEKYITGKIKEVFPNDNIVSEEFNSSNKCEGRCWVLDPIDGTANFSRGLPMWNIQLAFVENSETKCAVIYCPAIDELYSADETGAYLNGEKISVDKDIPLKKSIVNMTGIAPKTAEIFKTQMKVIENFAGRAFKMRTFGSSGFEFCMVASNKLNAYITFYSTNIWDHIPGIYLCRQAGCEIIDQKLGNGNVCVACATKELKEEFEKVLF